MDNSDRDLGDAEVQSNVDALLEERGIQYGDSWKLPSYVVQLLPMEAIRRTPYIYAWWQILSKLIRALTTPNDPEHWNDIAGYATLVVRDINSTREVTRVQGE